MSTQKRANEADVALASAPPEAPAAFVLEAGAKKKEKHVWKTKPCKMCGGAASEMHASFEKSLCLECNGLASDMRQRAARVAQFRNTARTEQEASANIMDAAQIEKESRFVPSKDDPFKSYDPGVVRHSVCKICKDIYRLVLQEDAAKKLRLSSHTNQSYDHCHACLQTMKALVSFNRRKAKVAAEMADLNKEPF